VRVRFSVVFFTARGLGIDLEKVLTVTIGGVGDMMGPTRRVFARRSAAAAPQSRPPAADRPAPPPPLSSRPGHLPFAPARRLFERSSRGRAVEPGGRIVGGAGRAPEAR
jgi:hypothetical protein